MSERAPVSKQQFLERFSKLTDVINGYSGNLAVQAAILDEVIRDSGGEPNYCFSSEIPVKAAQPVDRLLTSVV